MTTGPRSAIAILLACSAVGPGCAQPGGPLARRTTIGTLKASVSELEYEKEQLGRKVAELQAENRRIEGRLAQEEAANGELSARLDDARVLLRGKGYDSEELAGPKRRPSPTDEAPVTTPAGRTDRPGRKPPFARIPGWIDSAQPPDAADGADDDPLDDPAPRRRDPGPQGRLDDQSSWQRADRGSRSVAAGFP